MHTPFTCLPWFCGTVLICFFALGVSPSTAQDDPNSALGRSCVVLLHGLARTHRSMNKMASALDEAGYHTINMDYPSRKKTIEDLALGVIPEALRQCRAASCRKIHFVTHSMGGILLRYYLSLHPIGGLGRVVMLSPPNMGSEVVDALKNKWYYKWYNGPAGAQLGTDGITALLGPVDFPLGVITGNVHAFFDARWADIIPGADDGKVSVERAKVEGMTDFLVLPYSHPYIMGQSDVIFQTLNFLAKGSFAHPREWQTEE
jgi:triacylglycerol lipase